jgi:PKD repeat protein
VKVADKNDNFDDASVTVSSVPGNRAPNGTILQPTSDVGIAAGGTVYFDGIGTDPDSDPITYSWSFGDGRFSSVQTPGNVQYNTPGVYNAVFYVTDSNAITDPTPDSRVITVGPKQDHNIALTSVIFPASGRIGQSLTFSARVSNVGNLNENVTLRFFAASGEISNCRATPANLAPGQSTSTFSCSLAPFSTGPLTLNITADSVPEETSLADNTASATINVGPMYDHDLAVTGATFPAAATLGNILTFSVAVTNFGNNTESSTLRFFANSIEVIACAQPVTVAVFTVTPTYSCTYTPSAAGNLNLTVNVDPVLGETYLANNKASSILAISPVAGHDVAVSAATFPASARVNVPFTLSTNIANLGIFTESSTVRFYADGSEVIGCRQSTGTMAPGGTLPFTCTTTVGRVGNGIALNITVDAVPGETNLTNNMASVAINFINATNISFHSIALTGYTFGSAASTVTVSSGVINNGTYAENSTLRFSINGAENVACRTLVSLPAATVQLTVSCSFGPLVPGTYNFLTRVDPVFGEINLADNSATSSLVINPTLNQPPNTTIISPMGNVAAGIGSVIYFDGTATDADGNITAYIWNFGDGRTSNLRTPGFILFGTIGTYTVTFNAQDNSGAWDPTPATRTITITSVAPGTKLSAGISMDRNRGKSPLTVNLNSVVIGGVAPYTYYWLFADATSSKNANVTKIFNYKGTYYVRLWVTDANGSVVYSEDVVFVNEPSIKTPEMARSKMQITNLGVIGNDVMEAGQNAYFQVSVKNYGNGVDHASITVAIPDLGIYTKVGPFKLNKGDEVTKSLALNIPIEAAPGTYYVMLATEDSDDQGTRRIRYVDITVK